MSLPRGAVTPTPSTAAGTHGVQTASKRLPQLTDSGTYMQHEDALASWKSALDVIQDDSDLKCVVLLGRSRCYTGAHSASRFLQGTNIACHGQESVCGAMQLALLLTMLGVPRMFTLHAEYATYLRSIPAEASECAARYALEPPQLAKLGLLDAERGLRLRPDVAEGHMCRADALIVLEDYEAAEDALVQALSYDASDGRARVRKYMQWPRHVQRQSDEHCLLSSHKPAFALATGSICQMVQDDIMQ